MVLAGCALAVWFAAGALAGDAATLQLSNGSAITGNVTAADADSITIDKKRHALADVIGVDWGGPFGPPSLAEAVVFANGDWVSGAIISAGSALRTVTQKASWGKVEWRRDVVARLVFDPSTGTRRRLLKRLGIGAYPMQGAPATGGRVLIRGDLIRVSSRILGRRELSRRETAFVVLDEAERSPLRNERPHVRVLLRSGDSLSGVPAGIAGGRLRLTLPMQTEPATVASVPVSDLRRLIVVGGRATYLSDLPAVEKNVPYLFSQAPRAIRDASCDGRRVRIDGTPFLKGLCTQARTELSYDIGGRFERFEAMVGPDASSGAGTRVRFRVYAEKAGGRKLYDSGVLPSTKSKSADVRVAIDGVKRLVLVTDWGRRAGPRAVGSWGGARMIAVAEKAP
jgi:hypothetical protein